MVSGDVRKMVEYRTQLDRERELKLQLGSREGKKTTAIDSGSEGDDDDDTVEEGGKKNKSKKEKKERKHKKDKKHKVCFRWMF